MSPALMIIVDIMQLCTPHMSRCVTHHHHSPSQMEHNLDEPEGQEYNNDKLGIQVCLCVCVGECASISLRKLL